MHANPILQHLEQHGQLLDADIASATGIPLPEVRVALSGLEKGGLIFSCNVTRFVGDETIEGLLCRSALPKRPAPKIRKAFSKRQPDPPIAEPYLEIEAADLPVAGALLVPSRETMR